MKLKYKNGADAQAGDFVTNGTVTGRLVELGPADKATLMEFGRAQEGFESKVEIWDGWGNRQHLGYRFSEITPADFLPLAPSSTAPTAAPAPDLSPTPAPAPVEPVA